ncbi:hypothetical protein BSLA_01r3273 [Burkholderia stabilis]|nr:hypothetical protein BSLA_01r3273 [Burkholderia stabilis]
MTDAMTRSARRDTRLRAAAAYRRRAAQHGNVVAWSRIARIFHSVY